MMQFRVICFQSYSLFLKTGKICGVNYFGMNDSYIAHVKKGNSDEWEVHSLEEHLLGTAKLASSFAEGFSSEDWAYLAGLWHDLGKYSQDFQQYIRTASGYEAHLEGTKGRVDHSTAGAIHAIERLGDKGRILAYLIAGHHAGLPDWENAEAGRKQLQARIRQRELLEKVHVQNPPENILNCSSPDSKPQDQGVKFHSLWIRMLFSCLVDADFLDTEEFMNPSNTVARNKCPSLEELMPILESHLEELTQKAEKSFVNEYRVQILSACLSAAESPSGIYSLTVPTGGGKTLSSMAYALRHAIRHKKQRIIYVIPYTSIIEQTANIFRSIFGDCIVEHHSNIDPERETVESRLATENWDAPIIVTTNVQFFESLFAARTSRTRKLHRIVDSVIIMDEAQTIPPDFLKPILMALQELADAYKATIVLCTATQPALTNEEGNSNFKGLTGVKEIIPKNLKLYEKLKRVDVKTFNDLRSPVNPQDLANSLLSHDQVLCIVNRKDESHELASLMPEETIHLSGYMCGEHRSLTIQNIKSSLKAGAQTRVISTQLVEAGVDIDFPVVYRAFSGLDSIAQAAGRCNREGRQETGDLLIFKSWRKTPPGHLRHMEAAASEVFNTTDGDPLMPDKFKAYFQHLYWMKGEELDKERIIDDLTPDRLLAIKFREAARKFQLIDESRQQSVFVLYGKGAELIQALKKNGPDRWLMRKLQRYSISLPRYAFDKLLKAGDIVEIRPGEGFYAQAYESLYHPRFGFLVGEDMPIDVHSLLV